MARIIPIDTSAFEQRQIIPRPQRPAGQGLRETAQNAQSIGAILKTLSLASDFFGPAAAGVSKLTDTDAPKQRAALEQAARARVKAQRQKGVAPRRGTEEEIQEVATIRETRGVAPSFATGQAAQARRRQSIAAREGGQRLPGLTESQRQFVMRQPAAEQQRAALRSVLDTPPPQTQEDIDLSGFMDIEESTAPPVPTAAPPMVARPQPSRVGGQMPSYEERMKPRAVTEAQLEQAGAAAVEREGKYSFDELTRRAALATDQKQLDQVMSAFDRSGGIGVHPQTIGEIFSGAHIDRARKELSEHTKRFVPQSALEAQKLKTEEGRTDYQKVLKTWRKAMTASAKALEVKRLQSTDAGIEKMGRDFDLHDAKLKEIEQKLKRETAVATTKDEEAKLAKASAATRKRREKLKNKLIKAQTSRARAGADAATALAESRRKGAEGKPTAAQRKAAARIKIIQNQILGLDKLRAKAASEGAGGKVKIDEKVLRRLDKKFIIKLKQSAATKERYVTEIDAIKTPLKDELTKLQGKKKGTVLSGLYGKTGE